MKAAIALLTDYETQNVARRMVYALCHNGEIQFFGSLLPTHISLKQPFDFEDMDRLEACFDNLAGRVAPLTVELDGIYYTEWADYAILGLNVIESSALRALHNQINLELREVVADPSAAHDGEVYRFHMTLELGPVVENNPYKAFYDRLKMKKLRFSFVARYLAMFMYKGNMAKAGAFTTYRIMELGG